MAEFETDNLTELEAQSPENVLEAPLEQVGEVPPKRKLKFFSDSAVYAFLLAFGLVIVSWLFLFQVYLTPIKVVGSSMQPTMNLSITSETDEDHCDVVYYRKADKYNNNDIVIGKNTNLKYISDERVQFFIKRVIACPGQTIKFYLIEDGTEGEGLLGTRYYYEIAVLDENGNDINLDQSYLSEPMYFTLYQASLAGDATSNYYFPFFHEIFTNLAEDGVYEYNVPEGCYFVMGDNRNGSEDSRYFGAVSVQDIEGAVKLTVSYGKNIFYAIWIKLKSRI